jgi:Alpha/beta hydrolase domain
VIAFVLAAAVVTGPISGGDKGQAFGAMPAADLSAAAFTEREYFIAGTATAFKPAAPLGVDGAWKIAPDTTAAYKIRLLVRRPADAKTFNGIVVVEWLNVTALAEGAADFMQMHELVERDGYAWVGVGAQAAGINSPRSGLKDWDRTRYGSLVHPGDAYSYDIFTQAADAIRHSKNPDVLEGLTPQKILATGRSQSAFRLVTYVNAVHPIAHPFDGYLIHSRGANASGLAAEGLTRDASDNPVPAGAHIRTDIDVPILDLQTEGDMVALRAHLTHQPPFAHYRRWELAGAAHAETPRWIVEVPPALDMGPGCKDAVNSAPHHAVVKAALAALTQWVRSGKVPAESPAIEIADPSAPDPIARDARGLAKGGIRLPEMDAPTATIDGGANGGAQETAPGAPRNFCFLFGRTKPFDDAALRALYPTHDLFVKKFTDAATALEKQGYFLKPEADAARKAAQDSRVGR